MRVCLDLTHLKDSNCNKHTIDEVRGLYCVYGWMDESHLEESNCNKHNIDEMIYMCSGCLHLYITSSVQFAWRLI